MGATARIGALAAALLVVFLAFGRPASAQTLKFCNWRPALSDAQAEFVASLVPLGTRIDQLVSYRGGDENTFSMLRECALDVRRRVCSDKLLMGLIDPKGALLGGAAGLAVDARNGPSLLGGLLGSGAVGMVGGVVSLGACNKKMEEVYGPMAARLGPVVLTDLVNLRYDTYRASVAQAMRDRRISAQEGSQLLAFTDQVARAARESR